MHFLAEELTVQKYYKSILVEIYIHVHASKCMNMLSCREIVPIAKKSPAGPQDGRALLRHRRKPDVRRSVQANVEGAVINGIKYYSSLLSEQSCY